MKKLFAGLFVAVLVAIAGNLAAQNVSIIGTFLQVSGLGVGMAPTGVTGGVNAPIYSWPAAGAILPAAATITPTVAVHHISGGAVAINTIAVPVTCSPTCQITLLPDNGGADSPTVATTVTGGNILQGTVAVTNRALIMTWDGLSWKPSY